MWPSPSLLPRKDNTLAHSTPRAGTPSWGHISPGPSPGSSKGVLSSPMNILEEPGVSSLLHQECCAGGSAGGVCSQDASKKHPFTAHNQTEPNPPEITTVMSPMLRHPQAQGFVLKKQPRLSPLAVRSLWCQSPAREPEPVIFIRGCSLWGPSASSQEKQATGENLSLLMAFPPPASSCSSVRAAPSLEGEYQRGQLVSPAFSSNKSNCLENTSGWGGSFKWTRRTMHRAGATVKVKIN